MDGTRDKMTRSPPSSWQLGFLHSQTSPAIPPIRSSRSTSFSFETSGPASPSGMLGNEPRSPLANLGHKLMGGRLGLGSQGGTPMTGPWLSYSAATGFPAGQTSVADPIAVTAEPKKLFQDVPNFVSKLDTAQLEKVLVQLKVLNYVLTAQNYLRCTQIQKALTENWKQETMLRKKVYTQAKEMEHLQQQVAYESQRSARRQRSCEAQQKVLEATLLQCRQDAEEQVAILEKQQDVLERYKDLKVQNSSILKDSLSVTLCWHGISYVVNRLSSNSTINMVIMPFIQRRKYRQWCLVGVKIMLVSLILTYLKLWSLRQTSSSKASSPKKTNKEVAVKEDSYYSKSATAAPETELWSFRKMLPSIFTWDRDKNNCPMDVC